MACRRYVSADIMCIRSWLREGNNMPETIIVWEAPRLRGTCLSYAILNGLSSSGKTVVFMDEPLHWRRFHPHPVPSETHRLDYLFAEIGKISADAVVVKVQVSTCSNGCPRIPLLNIR